MLQRPSTPLRTWWRCSKRRARVSGKGMIKLTFLKVDLICQNKLLPNDNKIYHQFCLWTGFLWVVNLEHLWVIFNMAATFRSTFHLCLSERHRTSFSASKSKCPILLSDFHFWKFHWGKWAKIIFVAKPSFVLSALYATTWWHTPQSSFFRHHLV